MSADGPPRGLEPGVRAEDLQATEPNDRGGEDGAVAGWVSAAIIVLALVADYVIFRFLLDSDYVHWYVANGGTLALVLTVFALAVNLDDEPGLVSAHPAQYVGAWFAFFGEGSYWLSGLIRRGRAVPFWDALVTMVFAFVWTVVEFVWLLVVVPAQYVVNLVCGAPVRMALSTGGAGSVTATPPKKTRSRLWISIPERSVDLGGEVREKPVTATAAISAVALFGLGYAV